MMKRRSLIGALVIVLCVAGLVVEIVSSRQADDRTRSIAVARKDAAQSTAPPAEWRAPHPQVSPPRSVTTARARALAAKPATDETSRRRQGSPTAAELQRIRERVEENEVTLDAAYDSALQSLGLSDEELDRARRVFGDAARQMAELEERAAAGLLVDQAEIDEEVADVLAERERLLTEILGEERARRLARTVLEFLHETKSADGPP